jgi:hypothetical protein
MTDHNTVAFNQDEKRKIVLKELRSYNGKPISFEHYVKDYLRSMAFLYHTSGANAKKYSKMMNLVEQMAKHQWELLPQIKEKYVTL